MDLKDVEKEANYLGLFLAELVKACKKYRESWRYITLILRQTDPSLRIGEGSEKHFLEFLSGEDQGVIVSRSVFWRKKFLASSFTIHP